MACMSGNSFCSGQVRFAWALLLTAVQEVYGRRHLDLQGIMACQIAQRMMIALP